MIVGIVAMVVQIGVQHLVGIVGDPFGFRCGVGPFSSPNRLLRVVALAVALESLASAG